VPADELLEEKCPWCGWQSARARARLAVPCPLPLPGA